MGLFCNENLFFKVVITFNLKFIIMKLVSQLMLAFVLLPVFASCTAQIRNAKTEIVKIYGNCGMCKSKIENAGNLKKIANVDWNADTNMATLTFDATKTNQDEILKRIALVGYDSDQFLAPDAVYTKLAHCCQYDRVAKVADKVVATAAVATITTSNQTSIANVAQVANMQKDQLKDVFDSYFDIKDALVKTDGNMAAAKATSLVLSINAVQMGVLKEDEHIVWMKVSKDISFHAQHIAETKDAKHQRDHFDTLSENIYNLIKVSKQLTPVYYQFCPMANNGQGANWLSKDNTIKNPYYGSMMLSCGKTIETIK